MAEKDDPDHLQKLVNVPDRPICDSPVQNIDLHQLQKIAVPQRPICSRLAQRDDTDNLQKSCCSSLLSLQQAVFWVTKITFRIGGCTIKSKKGNTLRLLSLTLQFEKQEIVFRPPKSTRMKVTNV